MDQFAPQIISLVQSWVEQSFPGSIRAWSVTEDLDGSDGFAVVNGSALSLIFISSTELAPWQWHVNVYSGVAIDVPDVVDSLL